MAALRNTLLAIVHDSAEPLIEVRQIFAENRFNAIAAAQRGFLWMTLGAIAPWLYNPQDRGLVSAAIRPGGAMPSIVFSPVASEGQGGTYEITGQTQGIAAGSTLILKALSEFDPTHTALSGLGDPKVQEDGSFSLSDIALSPQTFITASYTDPKTRQITTAQAPFSLDGFLNREDVYSPVDGAFLYEATLLEHGAGTRIDVAGGGEAVQSFFDDTIDNGGAPDNTFVFAPGHGQDVVNLFRVDGPDHDTLSFATSDFGGSVAAVLHNTHNAEGGAVIVDPSTGDTVKLQGISKARLVQNAGDISFHA